ncbi:hypothetical protein KSP39_PZI005206 [Platanthera zijinensis]|uniref:Uncharacterized protein n=1 Tax=Platanthera zijinensis TaxID=2320716 RepID=A0AAP0BSI1_9ASPA
MEPKELSLTSVTSYHVSSISDDERCCTSIAVEAIPILDKLTSNLNSASTIPNVDQLCTIVDLHSRQFSPFPPVRTSHRFPPVRTSCRSSLPPPFSEAIVHGSADKPVKASASKRSQLMESHRQELKHGGADLRRCLI